MQDNIDITGFIHWEVREASGLLVRAGWAKNLVTNIGDRMYGDRGAAIAAPPAAPTGMKLGTANATPSKSGGGAALGAYLDNSHQAFDGGYPASSLVSSKRAVVYRCTWAPGKATSASAIREVVLINDALANATSVEASTIARALVTGVGSKPSGQSLTIAWTQRLGSS